MKVSPPKLIAVKIMEDCFIFIKNIYKNHGMTISTENKLDLKFN